MRGSVFGIKKAFNAVGLVSDRSMTSSPSRKKIDVVVQPLLVGAFAVRITKHKIIRVLQQYAVTGREGVGLNNFK